MPIFPVPWSRRFRRRPAAAASLGLFAAIAFTAVGAQAAPIEPGCLVTLRNGDHFGASITHFEPDGELAFSHPESSQPISFRGAAVARIDSAPVPPSPGLDGAHRIFLDSGEILPVADTSMRDGKILASAPWGQPFAIPLEKVRRIEYFNGPPPRPMATNDASQWLDWNTPVESWPSGTRQYLRIDPNGHNVTGNGFTVFDADLPDRVVLEFDLEWHGNIPLGLVFFAEPISFADEDPVDQEDGEDEPEPADGNEDAEEGAEEALPDGDEAGDEGNEEAEEAPAPENRLQQALGRRDMSTIFRSGVGLNLAHFGISAFHYDEGSTHRLGHSRGLNQNQPHQKSFSIRIEADRAGSLRVFSSDEEIAHWTFPDAFGPPGSRLAIFTGNNPGADSPAFNLRHLSLREWDGSPPVAPGDASPDHDVILTSDGDRLVGTLGALDEEFWEIETSIAPLQVALPDIRAVLRATKPAGEPAAEENAEPEDEAGREPAPEEVPGETGGPRVVFHGGFVLKPDSFAIRNNHIQMHHPLLGPLEFEPHLVRTVNFTPDSTP